MSSEQEVANGVANDTRTSGPPSTYSTGLEIDPAVSIVVGGN